jgi:chondroitin AC lyase
MDYGSGVLECGETSYIGLTDFVGGTTDGLDAVASFDYLDPQTKTYSYKKSWFFFDDIILILITNITCTKSPCNTNHVLDSRHLIEPIAGPISFPTNGTVNSTLSWLHHDSIGYFFKGNGNVFVDVGNGVHGDWSKIGVGTKKDVQNLFTAWVDDQSPSYEYLMIPDVDLTTFQGLMSSKTLDKYDIVINNGNIQAVFDSIHNRLGVVFWTEGAFSYSSGWNLESSAPAIVLVKEISSSSITLSVADPTQKLKSISISIDRKVSCSSCYCEGSCTCGTCTPNASNTTVQFTLPTLENAGSSITQTLLLK